MEVKKKVVILSEVCASKIRISPQNIFKAFTLAILTFKAKVYLLPFTLGFFCRLGIICIFQLVIMNLLQLLKLKMVLS